MTDVQTNEVQAIPEKKVLNRDITLDIVRGIAIILMVLGHIGYPLNTFIYLFHMAVFFIISGYFFNSKCYQSSADVKKYVVRKIKTLYLPFITWNIFLIFIHNFLISVKVYSTTYTSVFRDALVGATHYYTLIDIIRKSLFSLIFLCCEQMASALWFLRVLFFVSIISCIGHYLVNKFVPKEKFNVTIGILYTHSLIIGFVLSYLHFNFYTIGTMLTAGGLFYLGILIHKFDKNKINIPLFILSIITLIIAAKLNIKIELSGNIYPNPIYLAVLSYLGYVFLYHISFIISKIQKVNSIFCFLGQSTLYILLFHLLGFKLFSYIQTKYYDYPIDMLAAFPVITNNLAYMWCFYLITSIIVSIILMYVWMFINFVFNLVYSKLSGLKS